MAAFFAGLAPPSLGLRMDNRQKYDLPSTIAPAIRRSNDVKDAKSPRPIHHLAIYSFLAHTMNEKK
jgi:hypothetical protein